MDQKNKSWQRSKILRSWSWIKLEKSVLCVSSDTLTCASATQHRQKVNPWKEGERSKRTEETERRKKKKLEFSVFAL